MRGDDLAQVEIAVAIGQPVQRDVGDLRQVRLLLDEVESLEEFRDRLLDLYADIDDAVLAGALRLAFAWSDLNGRDSVG